jgi:hypothetical protein
VCCGWVELAQASTSSLPKPEFSLITLQGLDLHVIMALFICHVSSILSAMCCELVQEMVCFRLVRSHWCLGFDRRCLFMPEYLYCGHPSEV